MEFNSTSPIDEASAPTPLASSPHLDLSEHDEECWCLWASDHPPYERCSMAFETSGELHFHILEQHKQCAPQHESAWVYQCLWRDPGQSEPCGALMGCWRERLADGMFAEHVRDHINGVVR